MTQAAAINTQTTQGLPNMLMVSSGKGGVGKTWFSITFAHALAKNNKKVLLFDGDLGLANVDIQLGLTPNNDLGNYIDNECSLKDTIHSYEEGGFDIIVGRSGCSDLATISLSRMETLQKDLVALAKDYDLIILDLGAGLGGTVRQLSKLSGKCLLVTTDEPTSITDAYAFIKYSRSELPDLEMQLVINQSPSPRVGQKTFDTITTVCTSFLNYTPKLAGIIPSDKNIADTIRHQQPIHKRYPASTSTAEVTKIAKLYG